MAASTLPVASAPPASWSFDPSPGASFELHAAKDATHARETAMAARRIMLVRICPKHGGVNGLLEATRRSAMGAEKGFLQKKETRGPLKDPAFSRVVGSLRPLPQRFVLNRTTAAER